MVDPANWANRLSVTLIQLRGDNSRSQVERLDMAPTLHAAKPRQQSALGPISRRCDGNVCALDQSHQFGYGCDTEFLHDAPAMDLHGLFGHAKFGANLLVQQSGGD